MSAHPPPVSTARLSLLPRFPPSAIACGRLSRELCLAGPGGAIACYWPGDAGAVPFAAWDAGGPVARLESDSNGTGLCAVRTDGQVHCRNASTDNSIAESLSGVRDLCFKSVGGLGGAMPIVPSGSWPIVRQLACGSRHFCALSGLNIVRCWGNNQLGQLGRDGPGSTQAVTVSMPEPVTSIAAGTWHTCALLQSGRVMCWGSNGFCELGQPVLLQSAKPVIVVQ